MSRKAKKVYKGVFARLNKLKDLHAEAVAKKARLWEETKKNMTRILKAEHEEKRLKKRVQAETERLASQREAKKKPAELHSAGGV